MIYICVVSYNRPEILQRCVKSIMPAAEQHKPKVMIFEMTDGVDANLAFTGGEQAIGHAAFTYLAYYRNFGCAGARKRLAETLLAQGLQPDDITIWLDDDIIASGDAWLDALCAPIIEGKADITGVEGMEVLPTFTTRPCQDRELHYVSGGWCAISARVFLAGCMFDTRFHPNYWEDVDMCYQAKAKGFRIAQVENRGLFHQAHGGNPQQFEYSRAQFIAKHKNA
jgi:GT2 family glycosyltransferase